MAVNQHPEWGPGTVIDVQPAADDVARITINRETPAPVPPGSHLDVKVQVGARTENRSYSIVESAGDGRQVTLGVQLARHSKGGSRFMHTLEPGDHLPVTQPLQNFPLGVGAPRYVLLAGGIGVTALIAMASVLQARKADYTFVYAGRSRSVMAFLKHLQSTHTERLVVRVDDEANSLDLPVLLDQIAGQPGTELYLCGPIGLMEAVRVGWKERGLPPTDLRFETFGNSGAFEPEDFVVSIPALGMEIPIDAQISMLDALEDAGVPVMSDCRKGECGLCQVKVTELDGRIDHRDIFFSAEQKLTDTHLCACVSRVVTPANTNGGRPGRVTIDVV